MTLLLIEHQPNGRTRYIIRGEEPLPELARAVSVVAEHVPRIPRTSWDAGKAACWSCGFAWAAMWPTGCPTDALECLRCGEPTGTLVTALRCIECGWEGQSVAQPGTPSVRQCGGCRLMSATAA